MITREKIPKADEKMTGCEPPPSWYEQLRANNENLRRENALLREENAGLRRDNEKLTEIFEFARREFEKKDKEIESLKNSSQRANFIAVSG